jgi:RHS repeat-associated protein
MSTYLTNLQARPSAIGPMSFLRYSALPTVPCILIFGLASLLRAADPIDALLTGGIHPTAPMKNADYHYSFTPFKQQLHVLVSNSETNYFSTQRLDTVTWTISGDSLGLKVSSLGTNAAGTQSRAVLEPSGAIEDIMPGTLKLMATDVNAVTKTLQLVISPAVTGCPDGRCGAKAEAAAFALRTGVTGFPVKITGKLDPIHVLDPLTSPTSPPGSGYCPYTGLPEEEDADGGLKFFHLEGGREFEGEFGDAFAIDGSVELRFLLGRYDFGKSVGTLSVKETYPTNLLATPTSLKFCSRTNYDCEVLTNGAGIRQLKVPEGLVDIATNTAFQYYINVFPTNGVGSKVSGFYQTSGIPLMSIKVENPDTSNTNKLRMTDGDGYIHDYEWWTNGWKLTSGGGLREEVKTITNSGTASLITSEIRQNGTDYIATSAATYDTLPNSGQKITEQRIGEGARSLVNTLAYYTNNYGTGLLQQVSLAYGYWEYHEYDQNRLITNTCLAYLNQAPTTDFSLCRRIEYAYGTNAAPGAGDTGEIQAAAPRKVTAYILNKPVSVDYHIYLPGERRDIRCPVAANAWDNASNLVTITKYYTSGTNVGRVASVERPDGTMSIFQYEFGTNAAGLSIRTAITSSGVPNGGKTAITDGISNRTVVGSLGQFFSRTNYDIASGIVLASETATNHDAFNRPRLITHLDGTSEGFEHGCCGPISHTNREGTVTTFTRDPLRRTASRKMAGITHSNYFDAAGRVLQNLRVGTNGSGDVTTLQTNVYDTAGRLLRSRGAAGYMSTNGEAVADNRLTRTNFLADGSTRIEEYYRDGTLSKVTGTAVHGRRYTNGVEEVDSVWRAYSQEFKLDSSGNDTGEYAKTYFDLWGSAFLTIHSGLATNQNFFNGKGQIVKQVDADGVTTLLIYNSKGELEYNAIDMDLDGVIDYDGTDRITRTVSSVANNGEKDVQRTLTYVWATTGSAVSNLASASEQSLDGRFTWNTNYGVTSKTGTGRPGGGDRYQTNTAPDGSTVLSYYADGQLKTVTRKDSAGNQLSQTTHTYDSHGRQKTVTDARNGTTTYTYANEQVASVTTPTPGTGQGPQTTTYGYDALGRRKSIALPDGGGVTNIFHPTGELATNHGARVYPVAYTYDHAGRRKTMKTWKSFANNTGTATTTWHYNDLGQMTNKVYDDANGPLFFYSPAGRLERRKWARDVWTTNRYDTAGVLTNTLYSDGTANVIHNLDRQGRRTNIVDGAGTRYLTYSDSGLLLLETNASGTLAGLSLTNGYDSLQRRTSLTIRSNATALFTHSYTFDSRSSRLTNVSDGTYSARYDYLANSPLVRQVTFRSGMGTIMVTTKQFDYLNRLLSIANTGDEVDFGTFNYLYNDANQRVCRTDSDGSHWLYEYDKLGQLTSGKHYWADNTPVAGQQFEYAYDDIGNRTTAKSGGDSSGAGLRSESYTANALNQYSSRTVPGGADVIGVAHASATVTVNDQSPYRKGEYFWQELSINNASAAIWQGVTNVASLTGTNQTNVGSLFLPKTAESFTHDLDGNLTSDGRWTNFWDAENRLIQVESLSSSPAASKRKVTYEYDGGGRRVRHTTSDGSSGSYVVTEDLKFISDAWACLADINGTNKAVLRSYLWGLDLSGSQTGAGGVGGLLAMSIVGSGTHIYAYDGNGNAVGLVNAGTAVTSAKHEFSPFGQTLRKTGAVVADNRYGFSTKKTDGATDSIVYEYRHYRPGAGRWLSRDPIGKRGGVNELAFLANKPISHHDLLGLRLDPPVPVSDHRCDNPCEEAYRLGLAWNPDRQRDDWGGIVCCQGKKFACVWANERDPNFPKTTTAQGIVLECADLHEGLHLPDVRCPCIWNWGWLTRGGVPGKKAANASECRAFKAELDCLNGSKGSCGGDPACESEVDRRIQDVTGFLADFNCP